VAPKYSYLWLKSSVEGVRNLVIHNVYSMQSLLLIYSEALPSSDPFSLDIHEIVSPPFAEVTYTSADQVLLEDFHIH
jgi:hypothetical protein